jgi:multiple sugar transport system substrate-binding protein
VKKTLAALLALVMVLGMAPLVLAEEPTVIRVATWDATTTAYLITTKDAFEASHPGVVIEYIDCTSQEYNREVTTMLEGNIDVDVVDIKELSDMQNWAGSGHLEPLDGFIKDAGIDMSRYAGTDACYTTLDGTQYALPYRSDFWVLFYNPDLFDAAGVAYPTNDMTWDEYAEMARKLSSGTEGVDKVYGTHYHTWLSAVCNWAVCGTGYSLADGVYDNLKYFYDLVLGLEDDEAVMPYSELRAAGLHYRGAFEQGNIAMLPMGYWFVAQLISDIGIGEVALKHFAFTAVPHLEGVPAGASFGSPTGCSVVANSKNKELAAEFVLWRCSEEGAKAFAITGARPAYVSDEVALTMAAAEGFPSDETSLAALKPSSLDLEWPTGEKVNDIKTMVNEQHTLIMTRSLSVEDGVAEMNALAAEILE